MFSYEKSFLPDQQNLKKTRTVQLSKLGYQLNSQFNIFQAKNKK